MTPAVVGALDVIGSIGFTLVAFVVSFYVLRLRGMKAVFTASLMAMGVTLIFFVVVEGQVPFVALAVVYGVFLAPSSVLAPILACRGLAPSRQGEALGRLNRFSALGGAAAVFAAILWLSGSSFFVAQEMALRILFVVLGALAILGALHAYHSYPSSTRQQLIDRRRDAPTHRATSSRPQPNSGPIPWAQVHRPLLNDRLVYYFVLSFALAAGFGMSFSGAHPYMVTELKAPVAVAMGAILGFKLAAYAVSSPMGRGMAALLPLQVLSLTSLARSAALVTVALAALVLPYGLALPVVLLSVTLWGISAGAMVVAGPLAAARLGDPDRWQQSMAFFVAITNGGALAGMWAGGLISDAIGFAPMFLSAAVITGLASILLVRN